MRLIKALKMIWNAFFFVKELLAGGVEFWGDGDTDTLFTFTLDYRSGAIEYCRAASAWIVVVSNKGRGTSSE